MAVKKTKYTIHKSTLRKIILSRMEELEITRHRLAHSGRIDASPTTVFRYLSGQSQSSSVVIEGIMKSLGIDIVVDQDFEW